MHLFRKIGHRQIRIPQRLFARNLPVPLLDLHHYDRDVNHRLQSFLRVKIFIIQFLVNESIYNFIFLYFHSIELKRTIEQTAATTTKNGASGATNVEKRRTNELIKVNKSSSASVYKENYNNFLTFLTKGRGITYKMKRARGYIFLCF